MDLTPKITYKELTDKQVVELILALPHNEEAAAFLLYDRYDPLLHSIYNKLTRERFWYDDCVDELFIHLKCKDGTWRTLASFEWRSTLGCWLKGVAKHKFQEVLPKLIENGGSNLSLDANDDDPERTPIQLSDGGEEDYERRQRKVMLMEAIAALKDDDQRFVILKRLEGYDSNEIAFLLQKKWQKLGIQKYNNKGQLVVPDAAYVDVRTQRAKENLRILIVEIK
jgi:RNA polymerase sigma factor (sigma-70 family)